MKSEVRKKIIRMSKAAAMLLAAAVCFCTAAFPVSAADEKVVSSTTDDENVYLYVKGVSEITGGTVQIGNAVCQNVSVGTLDAFTTPMRTVLLIDNSRSIKQDRRADIRAILDILVDGAMEGEEFKVGTFSSEVTWLCDYTADHDAVFQALDAVSYENQETYFSDCLYDVIEEMSAGADATYSRVVIVSDGADNKTIGYTNSEVATLVERKNIPVYTIGTLGDNSALETMFSFSRASRADYYLLDGSVSNEDIAASLAADRQMICIRITPDVSQLDGGQKSIQAVLQTPAGEVTVTATVNMPFAAGTQTSQDQGTESEGVPGESGSDEAAQNQPETSEENKDLPTLGGDNGVSGGNEDKETGPNRTIILLIVGAAAAVLVIVVVVVIIAVSGQKKKKKAQQAARQRNANQALGNGSVWNGGAQNSMQGGMQQGSWQQNAGSYGGAATQSGERTMILGAENNNMPGSGDTMSLWSQQMQREVQTFLVLRDTGRQNVMFKVPIRDVVRIGRRDADIVVDYDKYISSRQCEIIKRGELLYIRDLGSSNGTFYENVRIYDQETPIVSGGTIRIGQTVFTVILTKE